MSKMKLADEWLEQNVGRPRDRMDFDIMAGSHVYKLIEEAPNRSVWATSLSNNILGFILSLILWPIVVFFAVTDVGYMAMDLWLKIVLAFVGILLVATALLMTSLIFYKRKLTVDHEAQELRFSCWTDKPYQVIPLKDIRGMSFENIQHMTSDDGVTATHVLVAELHDGRIASIAFSPPAGLFEAITGWTRKDMAR